MKRGWLGLKAVGLPFVVAALAGCGATVYVDGDGDGDGQGGSGQGGEGAGGGGHCVPLESCNAPTCPSTLPVDWQECGESNIGTQCSYSVNGCSTTVECEPPPPCDYDGGCDTQPYYTAISGACSVPTVECESALDGDLCETPGDSCSSGDECTYNESICGSDHRWVVYESYDDCCYDDCCYDECCNGGPLTCPETQPVSGDYCDPCYDGTGCSYIVETPCGELEAIAYCDYSYSWYVEEPFCGK